MRNNLIDMRTRRKVKPSETKAMKLNLESMDVLAVIDVHIALNRALQAANEAVSIIKKVRGDLVTI